MQMSDKLGSQAPTSGRTGEQRAVRVPQLCLRLVMSQYKLNQNLQDAEEGSSVRGPGEDPGVHAPGVHFVRGIWRIQRPLAQGCSLSGPKVAPGFKAFHP